MKKLKLSIILKEDVVKIKAALYIDKFIEISSEFPYFTSKNNNSILDLNFTLKEFFDYLKNELKKYYIVENFTYKMFIKKSNIKIKFLKKFFYFVKIKKVILPEAEHLCVNIIEGFLGNNSTKNKNIIIEDILLNKKKLKKFFLINSLSNEEDLPHCIEKLFLNILNNKEIDHLKIEFFKELHNVNNLIVNKKLTISSVKNIKKDFNIYYNNNIIINLEDVWNINHNFLKSNKNIKKLCVDFYDEIFNLNYSELFIKHIKKFIKHTFIFRGGSYNINILNNKNFNISEFKSLKNLTLKNFINNNNKLKIDNCNNVMYYVYEIEFLKNDLIKKNVVKDLTFSNINKLELYFNLGIFETIKNIKINDNNNIIFNIALDELNYQNLKILLFEGKNNKNIKFYFRVFSYKGIVLVLNFIIDNYEFIKRNNIKIEFVNNIFDKEIEYHIIYKINKIIKKYLYKSLQQFEYNLKQLYLRNFLNQNIKIRKIEDIPNFLQKEFKNLFEKSSFYINNVI